MLSRIKSYGLIGLNGYAVTVEIDVSGGMPAYETVGLPDAAVRESKERVRAAIKNSGFTYPIGRITVNLAPADTRKEGSFYDLPIAIGMLTATGQIEQKRADEYMFLGELALDGTVRSIPGVLPMVIGAYKDGITKAFLPEDNAAEASYVEGVKIAAAHDLKGRCGRDNGTRTAQHICPAALEHGKHNIRAGFYGHTRAAGRQACGGNSRCGRA